MTTSDHLRGPWQAVLAECHGDVYASVAEAIHELGEDFDEELTVSVVRGTAAPTHDQMPGSWRSADRIFELEVWLVDPDDEGCGAEARFAQAQAMAAGLNAAGGAA